MKNPESVRITKVPLRYSILAKWPFQHLSYLYYFSKRSAILIEDLNLAYVPIPKVAHTSIKRVIAKIPENVETRVHRLPFEQIPLSALDTEKYFIFGFVRNPLERLVSFYERNINEEYPQHLLYRYGNTFTHKMPFSKFIEEICKIPDSRADKHFLSQHCFLLRDDQLVCNFLGKMEHFQKDWNQLNKQFPLGEIGRTNYSIKKELSNYFTTELLDMTVVRYQKDIELFDYQDEVKAIREKLKIE